MTSKLLSDSIAGVLSKIDQVDQEHRAIVGLDGFIDKIQRPVKTQTNSGSTYYTSLESFGQRIIQASEQSAQIELHTNTIKLGGNAPIFANALANLGISNTCVGTFGANQIHPVFQEIHPECQLISLGDAAETNALEFDDGKLILSELSTFGNLDWKQVKTQINLSRLAKSTVQAGLVGLVDWCNLPHASDIWSGFLKEIVQPNVGHHPYFFFDLADPSKKSAHQVMQVLEILDNFSAYGKVTLGLNENETLQLAHFLGLECNAGDDHEKLLELGQQLFEKMKIDQILIHPIDGCLLITEADALYLAGRVVEHPVVSTGGGDNFNAGYCFGLLNQFEAPEAMVTAMSTSGAYVQEGKSPDILALKAYMTQWMKEI